LGRKINIACYSSLLWVAAEKEASVGTILGLLFFQATSISENQKEINQCAK
jgi:hypothetical protein